MPRTFFTADLHLGHEAIIKLLGRPFASVEEMNRGLIDRWNSVVDKDDTVYVLGDFAYKSKTPARQYLTRLNGTKHLVKGNHDSLDTIRAPWASVNNLLEVTVDGVRLCLCHYGMRVWPRSRKGAHHLYGHSHGRLPGFRQLSGGGCLDVGVDCFDYYPAALPDILNRISGLPIIVTESGRADDMYE